MSTVDDSGPAIDPILQKDYYRKYGTSLRGLMDVEGIDPHAVVANHDWSPAEVHGDGVFDAAVESLMRAVGRTRADLDEALGHPSKDLVGA